MAAAGAALSVVIPSRWAFEAIGHDLGARRILAEGGSPLGPPLLASYGDAGTQSTGTYWLVLAAFAVVFLVATGPCSCAPATSAERSRRPAGRDRMRDLRRRDLASYWRNAAHDRTGPNWSWTTLHRKEPAMLTHDYTYANLPRRIGQQRLDGRGLLPRPGLRLHKPFLPERIAGVNDIGCLNDDEKRMLNQIRGNSYCHIFAFVEEYIVPLVIDQRPPRRLRRRDPAVVAAALRRRRGQTPGDDAPGLRAVRGRLRGATAGWSPGARRSPRSCSTASPLTALLLTSMIEWFTQLHYVEHVRDRAELDELFRDILRFHWIDESRHARLDSLLIDEVAADLTPDEREQAIDELLELGGAVDGLLAQQIELDIDALAAGRPAVPSPTPSSDEIRTPAAARLPLDLPRLRASNTPSSSRSSSSSPTPAPPRSRPPPRRCRHSDLGCRKKVAQWLAAGVLLQLANR